MGDPNTHVDSRLTPKRYPGVASGDVRTDHTWSGHPLAPNWNIGVVAMRTTLRPVEAQSVKNRLTRR